MRTKRSELPQTKAKIIDAAVALIGERGLAKASLKDIMAVVGMTPGGFYRYFGSRDDLLAEVISREADQTPMPNLNAIIDFHVRSGTKSGMPTCFSVAAFAPELLRESEEVRAHFTVCFKKWIEALSRNPSDILEKPVKREAVAVIAVLLGSLQLARAMPDEEFSTYVFDVGVQTAREISSNMAVSRRT